MSVHCIDFNRLEVYEAGALLVTLLAYPDENEHEDERRSLVHLSLCARMLRAISEMDTDWTTSPQLVKPIYLLQSESDCDRGLRQLKRRLRDRMVAARMAYPFLKEAESGKAPELPAGLNRLSINAMSELVLNDAGHTDPENVETRIWRPSLPVIHLASAVHGYLHLVEPETAALGFAPLLHCREVIEYVIRNAVYCESLLGRSRNLQVNADRLVQLRLK
jgi:hypothetical protein